MAEAPEEDAYIEDDDEREPRSAIETLTYLIIGAAIKVHRTLGPGFTENLYHKALGKELMTRTIDFHSEKELEVYYDGLLCGTYKADLIVAGLVVIELKAVKELCPDHLAQTKSYLKASGLHIGLLLNFGRRSLEVKRVYAN